MTSDELNAIKARNAARTQGTWLRHPGTNDEAHIEIAAAECSESDAAFIAACSEDVPALIAEVEQLTALLKLAYRAIYLSSSGLLRANLKNDIEAVLEDYNER